MRPAALTAGVMLACVAAWWLWPESRAHRPARSAPERSSPRKTPLAGKRQVAASRSRSSASIRVVPFGNGTPDSLLPKHESATPQTETLRTLRYEIDPARVRAVTTAFGLAWERTVTIGAGVREIRAHVPLFVPLDLAVRALWKGEPDERTRILLIRLDGREIEFRSERRPDGTLDVLGVPFRLGAMLEVVVTDSHLSRKRLAGRQVAFRRAKIERRHVYWELAMDDADWMKFELRYADAPPIPHPGRGKGQADVLIEVRRNDGTPAAGALVTHGLFAIRADEHGRALFEGVRAGLVPYRVRSPGMIPFGDNVSVPRSGKVTRQLQEPEGRDLTVFVADAAGRPVPHAELIIQDYGLVRDGVQIVPILTGPDGDVVLPNLPSWGLQIHARGPGVDVYAWAKPGAKHLRIGGPG